MNKQELISPVMVALAVLIMVIFLVTIFFGCATMKVAAKTAVEASREIVYGEWETLESPIRISILKVRVEGFFIWVEGEWRDSQYAFAKEFKAYKNVGASLALFLFKKILHF